MILLTQKYGQLGNRLAYLRVYLAFALEHRVTIVNFGFDEYGHYFVSSGGNLLTPHRALAVSARCLLKGIQRLLGPGIDLFPVIHAGANSLVDLRDSRIIQLCSSSTPVIIDGGWPVIDLQVLKKYDEQVRSYFNPVDTLSIKIRQFLDEARVGCDVLIGIHIRQGDYREWDNGRHYFRTGEYVDIMRRLIDIHTGCRVRFVVATNEEQDWDLFSWCDYRRAPGGTVEDLYALAGCDEIYGPQSSYSAWASFFGRVPFCWISAPNCFDRASKVME